VALKRKIDRSTGLVVEENPAGLETGDAAIVGMKPKKEICLERFVDFPKLGRFCLRDGRRTVAVGIILDVERPGQEGWNTKVAK
jgi:elongation factor 1-alpha